MSDTKAAEALIYNNSCFHLIVCLVFIFIFWSGCGYKGGGKKIQNSRGQHNSLSDHGLEF